MTLVFADSNSRTQLQLPVRQETLQKGICYLWYCGVHYVWSKKFFSVCVCVLSSVCSGYRRLLSQLCLTQSGCLVKPTRREQVLLKSYWCSSRDGSITSWYWVIKKKKEEGRREAFSQTFCLLGDKSCFGGLLIKSQWQRFSSEEAQLNKSL